jgi:hypothetical protein
VIVCRPCCGCFALLCGGCRSLTNVPRRHFAFAVRLLLRLKVCNSLLFAFFLRCASDCPYVNAVIIDYLVRHGHLSPDTPGYLDVVRELRS